MRSEATWWSSKTCPVVRSVSLHGILARFAAPEQRQPGRNRFAAARKTAIIGHRRPNHDSPADTIVEILCRRIETDGAQPGAGREARRANTWLTWNELAADVAAVAAALVRAGRQPGDRVAQVSENRYEWIIADLAIQMAGAIHVPIHAPLTGPQIAWQVRHSGAEGRAALRPAAGGQAGAAGGELPAGRRVGCLRRVPEPLAGRADRHAGRLAGRSRLVEGHRRRLPDAQEPSPPIRWRQSSTPPARPASPRA